MTYPYPEIKKWPLMGSAWMPFFICVIYVGSIPFIRRMANNDNEWAKIVLKYYMVFMAVVNWMLSIFFILMGIKLRFSLLCEPASLLHQRHKQYQQAPVISPQRWSWWWIWITGHDLENDTRLKEAEIRVAKGMWIYMITKLLEFTDQILIALRNRDVAPEEVAHHVAMVTLTWIGLRSAPGGSSIIWVTMNTTFLAIAFTYQAARRFLKDMGNINDNLWNRIRDKVIIVKFTHFVLAGFHAVTIILSKSSHCDYPKTYAFVVLVFAVLMAYINLPKVFPGIGGLPGIPGGGPGRPDNGNARNAPAPDNAKAPSKGNVKQQANDDHNPQDDDGDDAKVKEEGGTSGNSQETATSTLQRRRLKTSPIILKEIPPKQDEHPTEGKVANEDKKPFP